MAAWGAGTAVLAGFAYYSAWMVDIAAYPRLYAAWLLWAACMRQLKKAPAEPLLRGVRITSSLQPKGS